MSAFPSLSLDPAWQAAVAARPGYAVQQPGDVLSLTRALPWWNFRQAKKPVAGAAHRSFYSPSQ